MDAPVPQREALPAAPSQHVHAAVRHDWTLEEVRALFALPFPELMFCAQTVHRQSFDPARVQFAQLLSIKTGGCPEDCGYCSQSAHFETGVTASRLLADAAIVAEAGRAKTNGATRFCMGAAWRAPKDRDIDRLCATVRAVKDMGLETCMTLGMLTAEQAVRLKSAGLDYYNHNIDTSPEHYASIVTTRTFADRLATLAHVREAGMAVCCGGILGIGETESDRASMLRELANLPRHPESVPINALMPIEGTPLGASKRVDILDFVRTVAVARIMMPRSVVRLSAGREHMTEEAQALCLLAGANSIFVGDRLLTTGNPGKAHDEGLIARLGMRPETAEAPIRAPRPDC
ncbi:MAG: biotin synthase BioB [Hyphomicrobiaceae bacterium]|nr:biotin synthase BioB [Hyphomicrobiaceae bacterium]